MLPPTEDVISRASELILTEASDEALVSVAKAGDLRAFEELSERHVKKLLPRIYGITRNFEDAEDVLQDTLIRAFRNLKTFEGRSTFSTWLTRIAINSALLTLRKKKVVEVSIDAPASDTDGWHGWDIEDKGNNPENCYLLVEQQQSLDTAIGTLSPHLQKVTRLKHAEGYSTHEIASSLGISPAAAKSRLTRAKARLRTLLV